MVPMLLFITVCQLSLSLGFWAHRRTGHCIDQIRQYIMCSGDITPIPTRYFSSRDRNYVDSDVVHTCRDFESLRQWISDRVRADGGEGVTAYAESD
jgi:hypothetical protein